MKTRMVLFIMMCFMAASCQKSDGDKKEKNSGDANGWSPDEIAEFVDSCQVSAGDTLSAQDSEKLCQCAAKKVSAQVTPDQLEVMLEDEIASLATDAVKQCRADLAQGEEFVSFQDDTITVYSCDPSQGLCDRSSAVSVGDSEFKQKLNEYLKTPDLSNEADTLRAEEDRLTDLIESLELEQYRAASAVNRVISVTTEITKKKKLITDLVKQLSLIDQALSVSPTDQELREERSAYAHDIAVASSALKALEEEKTELQELINAASGEAAELENTKAAKSQILTRISQVAANLSDAQEVYQRANSNLENLFERRALIAMANLQDMPWFRDVFAQASNN
jgi:hypothetical protein